MFAQYEVTGRINSTFTCHSYHNIHTSLRIQMYLENIKLLLTNGITMYRIISSIRGTPARMKQHRADGT